MKQTESGKKPPQRKTASNNAKADSTMTRSHLVTVVSNIIKGAGEGLIELSQALRRENRVIDDESK